jgi:RNA recognition motif-containing protein
VGDVYIPRHFGSYDNRGFGFVRFLNRQDGEDAQRAMDGTIIDGREVRIQEAREKRPDNPREANRYRGYVISISVVGVASLEK